ncbi:MAG: DUF4234 domain-containing protein [Lachnospiraceae bacterium]|nr:DUF4234 domain-containing protein [Lachnospiraceae bacterium]
MRVEENRNLLTVILLTIVTCGLYNYYFLYSIARDMNVVCEGDGKQTGGMVQFILLSFITCGIYSWIWYYGIGNRMAENAPRYGLTFSENGTTILMWLVLGSCCCGIGIFVAIHILCKNMNALAHAYNSSRF